MSAEKVVKETLKQSKPKLMNIKIEKLHLFENHPYKVLDDESMKELVGSIKEYGLLNRIIVRPMDDAPRNTKSSPDTAEYTPPSFLKSKRYRRLCILSTVMRRQL